MPAKTTWTSQADSLLGTMSDEDLGTELGISHVSVHKRRRKLGVPAFGKIKWTPEMNVLLGTDADSRVAAELGVCYEIARWRRNELGIPSWRSQNSSKGTRRRQMRELPNTLTYKQWKKACEYFDNCCAYCGEDTYILTEDHLKPLSKGGPRTVLNIIPACWSCNRSKGNRRAHIWIYDKFGMKEGKEIIDDIVAYLREVSESIGENSKHGSRLLRS